MNLKIYALRDRLIDYYMQPFVGPDDKPVLASVARMINQGEMTSDIAQAPHHFEVWKLGEVSEDGHIIADRQLIADCSSLVRADIRRGGDAGIQPAHDPETGGQTAPRSAGAGNGANPGPVPAQAPPAAGKPPPADKAAR